MKAEPGTLRIKPNRGIHPFYLDMSVVDVLLILTGWRVVGTSESFEDRTFGVSVRMRSLEMELELHYRAHAKTRGDAVLYSIGTYQARLPSGLNLSRAKLSRIENELETSLLPNGEPVVVDGRTEIEEFESPDGTIRLFRNLLMPDLVYMMSSDAHPAGWG